MSRRLVALLSALLYAQLGVIVVQTTAGGDGAQVRGIGTYAKSTGTVMPGLPPDSVEGDLFVAIIETDDQAITAPASTPAWVEAPSSPSSGSFTRLTVFYRERAASETLDMRTFSDSGDHGCGIIMAIEIDTFNASDPINIDQVSNQYPATTAITITGETTDEAETLAIVMAGSNYYCNGCANVSGWTNANLTSLTEQFDSSCINAAGGSLAVATGLLESAQASGDTTATSSQSEARANFILFINPF